MCLTPQQLLYISSGTGSCPTKWPFDFLQPRKSLDGNRTCHWIDLIEATGGISSFYCQIKETLVYVQIQFSCMLESNERFNTDVSQADPIKCQKLFLPSASSQSSSTSCSLRLSYQRKSSDNRFTRSLIARSNSVIRQNLIYFSCSNGH